MLITYALMQSITRVSGEEMLKAAAELYMEHRK
jgi:hypothetical protein